LLDTDVTIGMGYDVYKNN